MRTLLYLLVLPVLLLVGCTDTSIAPIESYNQSYIAEDGSVPGRKELYHACAVHGVGVVAMKPYAAGLLLTEGNPSSIVLTPVQCVNYALTQPAVCTVVPGCKNITEMNPKIADSLLLNCANH